MRLPLLGPRVTTNAGVAAAMAEGTARYADAIGALSVAGLPTEFITTGGNNAALEVILDNGAHLLVSNCDDSLSWDRDQQQGWGVGLYRRGSEGDDGPMRWAESEETDTTTLLSLVRQVLSPQGRPA